MQKRISTTLFGEKGSDATGPESPAARLKLLLVRLLAYLGRDEALIGLLFGLLGVFVIWWRLFSFVRVASFLPRCSSRSISRHIVTYLYRYLGR